MDYDAIYSDVAHASGDVDYDALYNSVQTNPRTRVYTPEKGAIKQDAKNLLGGAIKGAANIGNTIGTLGDMLTVGGNPILINEQDNGNTPLTRDNQNRQAVTSGLQAMGVDPDSGFYGVGKVGAEVAGTAGVGNVLGGITKGVPMLSNSLRSGGFTLGGTTGNFAKDLGLRMAGGAGVGGASVAMVDPLQAGTGATLGAITPPAVKSAAKLGGLIPKSASLALGATTGAGETAISEAFKAGKRGATNFLENMRGNVGFDDVVMKAKQGLSNMRAERGAQYRSGMLDISNDKTVINFKGIDKAVNDVAGMGSYKGVQVNKNAAETVQEAIERVNEWKGLNPAEYHTPEGLDALKRSIGDIRDTTEFGTAARRAVDQIYNAIKQEIADQAPTYAKVMKDYSRASETLWELENSLSMGDKAKIDTSVRKLQSVMRNNASTNYGNRLDMVNTLEQQGGVDLMPDLAGQSLNSLMPRGLLGNINTAGMGYATAKTAGTAALAAPLFMPRVVGEGVYKIGSMAGGVGRGMEKVNQAMGINNANGLLGVPSSNYLPLSILESQTSLR